MTPAAPQELRTGLVELAKRSVGLVKACQNEESIKLYLVLPLLAVLGFDAADPLEVYPNHETDPVADAAGPRVYTADFAILKAGAPVLAVGAARTADLPAKRATIAAYAAAWPTAKLAIVGDGIRFDLYVDSVSPGVLDAEPFLTLALDTIAASGVSDEVADTLIHVTKAQFDPDRIAEIAHLQLVRKRLRAAFAEEAQSPSDDLARAMMTRIGMPGLPAEVIARHYGSFIKSAFEEALVLPVVQRLKAVGDGVASNMKLDVTQALAAADHERSILAHLRRRLAYLAETEAEFSAVERVVGVSYIGRLVVALDRDPDGRICDIVPSADGVDVYTFAALPGTIRATDTAALDAALRGAFIAALEAAGPTAPVLRKAS
jgi:hypothetical protein